MAAKYTEEQMALLSDEEREGLLDPDLLDDEPSSSGEDGADPGDAAEAGEGKAPAEAGDADAAATAADPAAASAENKDAGKVLDGKVIDGVVTVAEPEAGSTADPGTSAAPAATAEAGTGADEWKPDDSPAYDLPPANAQEKLDDIERRRAELAQKFDDGELNMREWREAVKPLDGEERSLHDQVMRASITRDAALGVYQRSTVPGFLKEHPEYADGSPLYNALDAEVRKLQVQQPRNPFDPRLLAEADRRVKAATLKALGLDPTALAKPAQQAAAKPAAQAGPKREIPPTLANVPASGVTETGTVDKFAYLDKLSGLAFEAALAKLSPADRDAYMAQ